jgi:hypothetical protein
MTNRTFKVGQSRMVRSFIEDKERQEHVRLPEKIAQRDEREQLRSAQEKQTESK